MSTNGILTQKEKELIAVGAAIAAGCQPCTAHHFQAVRAAGATEAEIRQAVDEALFVRNSATRIMTGLAEKHLGNGPVTEDPGSWEKPLMSELVSLGAALAVNCATNLEAHLQAARAAGATNHQIQTALSVARAIKKVAGEKVETIAQASTQSTETEPEAVASNGCGCQETKGGQAGKAGVGCNEQKNVAPTSTVKAEAVPEPCGCG